MKAKIIGSKEDLRSAFLSDIKVNGIEVNTGHIIEVKDHYTALDGELIYSFMGTYSDGEPESWLIRESLIEIIEG